MEAIPNALLRLADLPAPEADWPAIWRLADTFNGYKHSWPIVDPENWTTG